MTHIKIDDLEQNDVLDAEALKQIRGGYMAPSGTNRIGSFQTTPTSDSEPKLSDFWNPPRAEDCCS